MNHLQMLRRIVPAVLVLSLAATTVFAQHEGDKKKPLSPPATATGSIGGVTITIDYSAPSKRDRPIMGALVPYGQVWRTGANAATTMTTSGDLVIGGLAVPAGKYTLYTLPGEKAWKLIINKQNGQWGTVYEEKQDIGRVDMKVEAVKPVVETFVIAVKSGKGKTGALTFTWENLETSVTVAAK